MASPSRRAVGWDYGKRLTLGLAVLAALPLQYVGSYDPATGAHHLLDVFASTLDGVAIGATIGGTGVHTVKLDRSGLAGGAQEHDAEQQDDGGRVRAQSLGHFFPPESSFGRARTFCRISSRS